jgi:hypothetical protein
MKETPIATIPLESTTNRSVFNLTLDDIRIDELQRDDALGIPELGASASYYGCCSYASSL